MVCNILIITLTIFTATMGFNYINVTSLSYIHLPKKFFLIFAGSIMYMYQVFSSLLVNLHFFEHFFLTFMEYFFIDHPIFS